ncbi:MAG: ArsR family transcriptional regulator [Terricaulis sp.]|nr:ArsR family transcriptional regulator [Terricaulis sp.]
MKEAPDIAAIAALAGDPARANMLTALLNGEALTASELALEAGVTKQTASSHLTKLAAGGLVKVEAQGRHRYYTLADADVAGLLETLMGVAARAKALRTKPGPKDEALRHARLCYDHLAGDLGVGLYDAFVRNKWISPQRDGSVQLTRLGRAKVSSFGVEMTALEAGARPLCRGVPGLERAAASSRRRGGRCAAGCVFRARLGEPEGQIARAGIYAHR